MNDALPMRLVERVSDLGCDLQRLVERKRAFLEARGERLPVEMRHHAEVRAVGFADIVNTADMWMIKCSDSTRLALEPRPQVGVVSDVRCEDLDGDGAIKPRVAGLVDLPHATAPNQ